LTAVLAVLIPHIGFSQSSGAPSAGAPVSGAPAVEETAGGGGTDNASGTDNVSGTDDTAADDAAAAQAELESRFSIGEAGPGGEGPSGPSSFFTILRMVLVLALVAAVIYLVVFFLRRLSRPQAEQNPHVKILASSHLGGGRYVHVVSVGTKAWLIGSGEGGISHIADITDQEAVDSMLLDNSKKNSEATGLNSLPGFQALLKRFSGGNERPPRQD
jgi:flagellar protein FliO/FliZ